MATAKQRIDELDALIFNAIDKASPYALSQHGTTDTLGKISKLALSQLAITEQGAALMWLWINAYSNRYGALPVPPNAAVEVETVKDVIDAVYNTIEDTP